MGFWGPWPGPPVKRGKGVVNDAINRYVSNASVYRTLIGSVLELHVSNSEIQRRGHFEAKTRCNFGLAKSQVLAGSGVVSRQGVRAFHAWCPSLFPLFDWRDLSYERVTKCGEDFD